MDIVERLRGPESVTLLESEAANEIKRLRIDLEVEVGRRVKAQLFRNDMLKEIERLRKALRLIAAPSKVVAKGEEAVVALQLLLSSHRRTALKALGEKE